MTRTDRQNMTSLNKLLPLLVSEVNHVVLYCSKTKLDRDVASPRYFVLSISKKKLYFSSGFEHITGKDAMEIIANYSYFAFSAYRGYRETESKLSIRHFPLMTSYLDSLPKAVDDFLDMIDDLLSKSELDSL